MYWMILETAFAARPGIVWSWGNADVAAEQGSGFGFR